MADVKVFNIPSWYILFKLLLECYLWATQCDSTFQNSIPNNCSHVSDTSFADIFMVHWNVKMRMDISIGSKHVLKIVYNICSINLMHHSGNQKTFTSPTILIFRSSHRLALGVLGLTPAMIRITFFSNTTNLLRYTEKAFPQTWLQYII